jgi:hypothetical protein
MICEDDENNSEPEMVSHEDVQPEPVTSQKNVVTPQAAASHKSVTEPEVTSPEVVTSEKLAEDMSKARLHDDEVKVEKVVKRNEVVTPNVVSPAPPVATSPK